MSSRPVSFPLISAIEAHREIREAIVGDIYIVERNQLNTSFDSLLDIDIVDGVSFVDDERSAPSSA